MRAVAPLLVSLLLSTAGAQPAPCVPGVVTKFSITPYREHLRFQGTFATPEGFDPLSGGLQIAISYEPASDPGNLILAASLPASGFMTTTHGLRYLDRTAAVAGIKLVSIVELPGSPGMKKIKLNRRGERLSAEVSGAVQIVVTSGDACVRCCDSACTTDGLGTRMRCLPSVDPCP